MLVAEIITTKFEINFVYTTKITNLFLILILNYLFTATTLLPNSLFI